MLVLHSQWIIRIERWMDGIQSMKGDRKGERRGGKERESGKDSERVRQKRQ